MSYNTSLYRGANFSNLGSNLGQTAIQRGLDAEQMPEAFRLAFGRDSLYTWADAAGGTDRMEHVNTREAFGDLRHEEVAGKYQEEAQELDDVLGDEGRAEEEEHEGQHHAMSDQLAALAADDDLAAAKDEVEDEEAAVGEPGEEAHMGERIELERERVPGSFEAVEDMAQTGSGLRMAMRHASPTIRALAGAKTVEHAARLLEDAHPATVLALDRLGRAALKKKMHALPAHPAARTAVLEFLDKDKPLMHKTEVLRKAVDMHRTQRGAGLLSWLGGLAGKVFNWGKNALASIWGHGGEQGEGQEDGNPLGKVMDVVSLFTPGGLLKKVGMSVAGKVFNALKS